MGEPRTEMAQQATEGGLAMMVPMVLLAGACLVIGIFPASFIKLAFGGLADITLLGQVDTAAG